MPKEEDDLHCMGDSQACENGYVILHGIFGIVSEASLALLTLGECKMCVR